jgi:predicted dehydrogenase
MTLRVRVGVVGTGWWATEHHIPSLVAHERAHLCAVADRDAARAEEVATRFGVLHSFTDAAEMFDSGLVEAVVVATPHPSHHELARAALERGLHVLVEKPLALTAADAWDLVRVSQDRGLHLMVGCTYQFTSTSIRFAELVREGALGELLCVAAVFTSSVDDFFRGRWFPGQDNGPRPDTYSDPANAGGQAYTQASHPLGMLLHVTGAVPVNAHAFMTSGDLRVDIADALSFRLANGAVGSLGTAGSLRPGQLDSQVIHYVGTEAVAVQDLGRATVEIMSRGGDHTRLALEPGEQPYPAHVPARDFVDLVAGAGRNHGPALPAAWAVSLLEASYTSATLGGEVGVAGCLGPKGG